MKKLILLLLFIPLVSFGQFNMQLFPNYKSDGFSFSQEQEISNVRIMTYNIWNGFDWGRDSKRKANCINWIKSKSQIFWHYKSYVDMMNNNSRKTP